MTETVAIIGAVLGLLTAAIGLVVRLNRSMRRLNDMVDDWKGEPARPGVGARPGVLERLSAVESATSEIRYQVQSNSGQSAHDDVMRQLKGIQGNLDSISTRMSLAEHDHERVHREISHLTEKFNNHVEEEDS